MTQRRLFVVILIVYNFCNAEEDISQLRCIDFKDNSTWPNSVVKDLEECRQEAEDYETIDQTQTSGGRGDITTKIKGFLHKVWNRFINTNGWQNYKISILNCMWKNQRIYNVETKDVQWSNVFDLIINLKVNDTRKQNLDEALKECKVRLQDVEEPKRVLDTFKCFFTHDKTKASCPLAVKKSWQKQRSDAGSS